jgi:enoyl-CoA hydratase
MEYSEYQHLLFERKEHGVLLITMNRPEVMNATNARLHWELSRVWLDIGEDDDTRVAVITGAGRAFSAGGDLEMIESFQGDLSGVSGVM